MWKIILLAENNFAPTDPIYLVWYKSCYPNGYIGHWFKYLENLVHRTQVRDNGESPHVRLRLNRDKIP